MKIFLSKQFWFAVVFCIALLFFTGVSCMNSSTIDLSVSDDTIAHVASKTVYFGHQSVGYNILDGVSAIAKDVLVVDMSSDPSFPQTPAFIHSPIGENQNPISKIDDFTNRMNTDLSGRVDIAFLKFCYVDFDERTDIDAVFSYYKEAMAELSRRHPGVKFIHLTVPLVARQGGIKNAIKRMLGRDVYTDNENIVRQKFNALLRAEYKDVFDVARLESTRINGKVLEHTRKGFTYNSLVPEYTSDGGHLNDLGSRIIAKELLLFLTQY